MQGNGQADGERYAEDEEAGQVSFTFPPYLLEYNPNVENDGIIDVYSDSDWAGCVRTRKSTSGGVMMLGNGVVKTWSSTQTTIAQSSGEAEYYALVRAAAEGLGMQSIMHDLGWKMRIRL